MAHFGKDLDNFSAARTVQITGSETNENFTTYTIEVTVGSYTWTVRHRYSEFHELHEKLVMGCKLDKNLLPPKKLFGNQSESFIKKRQQDLQVYLQTVLHYLAHHTPPALTFFLDFHLYEIHGLTQALAEDLYNRGETILQSKEVYQVTPLQLYALTERLKLPEPTCDSGDVKKDLGHILDFITRAKYLQIVGSTDAVGNSNINMNQLKFDLSLFKSLQSLEVISCNFPMVQGLETIKQTLQTFNVYRTATTVKEVVLQDVPRWKAEDGTQLVGGWDQVVHTDLSHNFIKDLDESIQILWRVEHLNLSHNQLETMQHLHFLSQLTHLDLSNNRLRNLDSLHTKLGNIKCIMLSGNLIESLRGFSKLFSLEVLDVSNNKISKVEDVRPVCHLPCLEKLQLSGNTVTNTVDYRTKILEMFGDRVEEVSLDNHKASQKEKDTVAVRLALQKARDAKPRQSGPRKNSSSASLSDVYGGRGTPPLSPAPPTCESLPAAVAVGRSDSSAISQYSQRGGQYEYGGISSSAPQHAPIHSPNFPEFVRSTPHPPHHSNIFIPGRNSPSQTSISSCASTQDVLYEEAELPSPIPEAHPFDPSSEAHPASSTSSRREYNAADLPDMSSPEFVSWLETRLLSDDSTSNAAPAPIPSSYDTPPPGELTKDKVMEVMWCYAQQYSSLGVIFPCCAVLTTTKIIVERMCVPGKDRGEGGLAGVPELRPCIIVSLGNLQHVVIGPNHAYLRLEEAFVGKGGLFTLFALRPASLSRFADALKDCCTQLDISTPFDVLDLSESSDLLRELRRREEERLGVTSTSLTFVSLVKMKIKGRDREEQVKAILLTLSQNVVYGLDTSCVYWPPATFESAHEGGIHIQALREVPINEVDPKLSATAAGRDRKGSAAASHGGGVVIDFSTCPLIVETTKSHADNQGQLQLVFSSVASRETFLERLSNLHAEQAQRQLPPLVREREAPEGGNEMLDVGDGTFHTSQVQAEVIGDVKGDVGSGENGDHQNQNNNCASTGSDEIARLDVSSVSAELCDSSGRRNSLVGSQGLHNGGEMESRNIVGENASTTITELAANDIGVDPEWGGGESSSRVGRSSSNVTARPTIPSSMVANVRQSTGSSLPSSYEWKGYGFSASQNPDVTARTSHISSAYTSSMGDTRAAEPRTTEPPRSNQVSVKAEVYLNIGGLADIQSSGEYEDGDSVPTQLEQELRQSLRTYNLLHPVPARMRPITLMTGKEVTAFFLSKIAGSPSSSSSSPNASFSSSLSANSASESSFKAARTNASLASPEELRHVVWTSVVPYTDPNKEVVTFAMLSTRAIYLVSDSSAVDDAASTARPAWMTHHRNKSDSAVGWQTKVEDGGGRGGGLERVGSVHKMRGHQWGSQVKAYAVIPLSELVQVSMGLFDQFFRLTGPDANSVFTLATRDSKETASFVDKLKTLLSLLISRDGSHSPCTTPMAGLGRDKSPTITGEVDFYHAFAQRTNSMVEGLVYTHPSQVTFLYPGDDAIDDILFLIKAKVQAKTSHSPSPSLSSNLSSSVSSQTTVEQKDVMWLYILAYQILPPFAVSMEVVAPERVQSRCVVVTSHHLCLAREDVVTYPLPDFVRGLPEQPQHEVTEARRLESLKRILLSPTNPRVVSLVFWDEPDELVVDTSMQHFGGGGAGGKGSKGIVPEVTLTLFVHSQRDKDKLVQTLQKKWRELVPQVGRILDVVRE